jgi:hypothetical protein
MAKYRSIEASQEILQPWKWAVNGAQVAINAYGGVNQGAIPERRLT